MYDRGAVVREPRKEDVEQLSTLIYRFYMLNEEFDPLWSLSENAREEAIREAEKCVEPGREEIVLVVEVDGSLAGYIRGYVREFPMLKSRRIAVIRELYVHPSHRGLGLGSLLIDRFGDKARAVGAKAIAVEFPTQNIIAENFYRKLDFRRFMTIYIREVG
ncbi:MAG: GNAT family N-acetyltransferase [Aeropyrum sp.]|nr:GNAT family N-acetyltransferase [Aeropyrum sp.]MCE4616471.1 GNAT family N-acetyltransferase [Aeropyrum sp.]